LLFSTSNYGWDIVLSIIKNHILIKRNLSLSKIPNNPELYNLIILGLNRLQYVLDKYMGFFNEHRPH